MSVPAVRRLVVGVDGSDESVAALRWACREAGLRGAEVHAVHVREELIHSLASYAVPATSDPAEISVEDLVRSVHKATAPAIKIKAEVIKGLAARVLLDRCDGADMLILGTSSDASGELRSAGPVIRACLRRASCPVVVISSEQDTSPRQDPADRPAKSRDKVPVGV
jgi:nucleotide-binding universal stress UspA family protein